MVTRVLNFASRALRRLAFATFFAFVMISYQISLCLMLWIPCGVLGLANRSEWFLAIIDSWAGYVPFMLRAPRIAVQGVDELYSDKTFKSVLDGKAPCMLLYLHGSTTDAWACPILSHFVLGLRQRGLGYLAPMKKSLAYMPIMGWNMIMTAGITIDREHKEQAISALNKIERKFAEKTASMCTIAPEGTRRRTPSTGRVEDSVRKFKKGAFHMIKHLLDLPKKADGSPAVVVIPAVTYGAYSSWPTQNLVPIGGSRATVRFGLPIDLSTCSNSVDEIVAKCESDTKTEYSQGIIESMNLRREAYETQKGAKTTLNSGVTASYTPELPSLYDSNLIFESPKSVEVNPWQFAGFDFVVIMMPLVTTAIAVLCGIV